MSPEVPETASRTMSQQAVSELAAAFGGRILRPGEPDFAATATVHQLAATGEPALVVRPAGTADVAAAIAFARTHDLEIAVRSGGHSSAGHSTGNGVMVIDMRAMDSVAVDPVAGRLRAGGGVLAGAVITAAAEHGMTVPLGDSASVGVAGITLGGGVGYLSRQHGLTIDNLLEVELVTADGRVVVASATSEPELFWALRGGGGNFGIVTALEFRMVPAGMVYGGALLLPAAPELLQAIPPLVEAAPRELGVMVNLMAAPPAPFVPPDVVGQPVLVIMGVYNGDQAGGEAAWAPIRALAEPIADAVGPMPYPVVYRFTEGAATPVVSTSRAAYVQGIDDTLARRIIDAYHASPGGQTMFQVRVLGGAVADIPADGTAYAHRESRTLVVALTMAPSPADLAAMGAWADGVLDGLRGHATGTYVNFLADEGEARVREAYPGATFGRLAAAKAAWDPENVFRRNQNIPPALGR